MSVSSKALLGPLKALPEDKRREPIRFPQWQAVLAGEGFSATQQEGFRRAILGLLRHCKTVRAPATAHLIGGYIADKPAETREALRWFYKAARRAESSGGKTAGAALRESVPAPLFKTHRRPPATPPPAALDQGGADWERDLIAALRARGLLWRTEQSYREWGARFAEFCSRAHPMPPARGKWAHF
jgi:hypothetical protein